MFSISCKNFCVEKRKQIVNCDHQNVDFSVFVLGAYEYKSYTTVHPKSVAARTTHTYHERNKGKPLYVGNLTWVGLTFDFCLRGLPIFHVLNRKIID